jgi:hypothetical protein
MKPIGAEFRDKGLFVRIFGKNVYAVGGFVRDILRGIPSEDIDLLDPMEKWTWSAEALASLNSPSRTNPTTSPCPEKTGRRARVLEAIKISLSWPIPGSP